MNFLSTSFTHRGGVREHNEDAFLENPEVGVWVVADGMGGYQAGDVASQLTCDAVAREIDRVGKDMSVYGLQDALCQANDQIRHYGTEVLSGQTLGSTVVALMVQGGRYHLFWAGDSRCYRVREGNITQVSRDHSQVADMVEQGLLEPSEAESHPLSHVITRALGVDDNISLDYLSGDARAGDMFLLCSDGVSKEFSTEELGGFVGDGQIEDANLAIMHSALVNKCSDNITCIIVNVREDCYLSAQLNQAEDATVPVVSR